MNSKNIAMVEHDYFYIGKTNFNDEPDLAMCQ